MEDTIVLYSSPDHLNSMLLLAEFTAKHHPSTAVTIISTAPNPAVSPAPTITYHRLPAAALPEHIIQNPGQFFFEIPSFQNPNLRKTLIEISKKTRIRSFVIDFMCNSAVEVSRSLNLPTYFYVSSGAFSICIFLNLLNFQETNSQDIGKMYEFIEFPGCPPIHSLDFPQPMWFRETRAYRHVIDTAINMGESRGILVNSFDKLELKPKEELSKDSETKTPPVYFVGPLIDEKTTIASEHECLTWLDSQPSKSVVFLCFGRRGVFLSEQLKETAIGLENSGIRFLWCVRLSPHQEEIGLDLVLPVGFLERTMGRGVIVNSWAPQTEILKHGSVGGFVTHCGWSSVLEAVNYGVPMISWPLYAEQRMNRVFMVEEMKVAHQLDMGADGFVRADELEKRVGELMDKEKGKLVRERVAEMKGVAQVAVRKDGSSVLALENFIESVTRD